MKKKVLLVLFSFALIGFSNSNLFAQTGTKEPYSDTYRVSDFSSLAFHDCGSVCFFNDI